MKLRAIRAARTPRRVALAVLLGGLCLAPAASAEPVSLTSSYTCNFPLLDPQPLTLQITSDIPAAIPVNTPTGAFDIRATAQVSAEAARGLRALGSVTVEGTAAADATFVLPGGQRLALKVPVTVERTDIPAAGGFTVRATGQTPSLAFPQEGTARIEVGDVVLTLTPRLADGTRTGVEEFESECARDASQDATLATIVVGDQPAVTMRAYLVQGATEIRTLTRGSAKLSGTFDAELTTATGALTGDLRLAPPRARLVTLGIIPVTADLAFVQTARASGRIEGTSATLTARFKVRVPKLYLFGSIPVAGGESCQTKTASVAALASAGAFTPPTGGRLTGSYAISDLTGCGALTAFISPLTKGSGNTIDVNLTPKAQS